MLKQKETAQNEKDNCYCSYRYNDARAVRLRRKSSGADSDLKYVQDKGTLIVGITDFAPMDYQDGVRRMDRLRC